MNTTTPLYQMNRAALREQLSQALAKSRRATTREEQVAARALVTRIQRKLNNTKH